MAAPRATLVDPHPPYPELGPFCCFTGRPVRHWSSRTLFGLLHLATALTLPLAVVYLAGEDWGQAPALGVGVLGALLYLATLRSPRWHVAALCVLFPAFAWLTWDGVQSERSVRLISVERETEGTAPGAVVEAQGALERLDETALQGTGVSSFTWLVGALSICLLLALIAWWRSALASRSLPQRLWFARYHPTWRRRYRPEESPHPLVGLLSVREDALLSEKLVWLRARGRRPAFALGGGGRDDDGRVPLSELDNGPLLYTNHGRWTLTRALGSTPEGLGPDDPVQLRLFGERPEVLTLDELRGKPPVIQPAADLPVRDFFAEDNGYFGKHYEQPQDTRLLGLLLDSRPNPGAGDPALPRFAVILERAGSLELEYGHPDLMGAPYLDRAAGRLHLAWNVGEEDPLDLDLDLTRDSILAVGQGEDAYYLMYVAFAPKAEEALA